MLCALVMAGGKGTRFWPLSTEDKPKQFLRLVGQKTMIQMTVERIKETVSIDRIFICTTKKYVDLVREQVPEISLENIIIEPEGRNTAPCIALSTMMIKRKFEEAKVLVLPSDHLIKNVNRFHEIVELGEKFLHERKETILTLGMKPTRAEIGYGYIKVGERINNKIIYKVENFVEKPNKEYAFRYFTSGEYLWNSGMFIWDNNYILDLFKKYLPDTYRNLENIKFLDEENIELFLEKNYKYTDMISVDYGILEKIKNICVIPCEIGWDDVGNWTSVERYSEKDQAGNVFKGEGILYNSKNNIVLANKKILINNVEDLIVVETDDYVMISSKKEEQEIKNAKMCL
ncbi:MAG: mannose-1-phosphate guanylyltransferase [Sarcina sp.]